MQEVVFGRHAQHESKPLRLRCVVCAEDCVFEPEIEATQFEVIWHWPPEMREHVWIALENCGTVLVYLALVVLVQVSIL